VTSVDNTRARARYPILLANSTCDVTLSSDRSSQTPSGVVWLFISTGERTLTGFSSHSHAQLSSINTHQFRRLSHCCIRQLYQSVQHSCDAYRQTASSHTEVAQDWMNRKFNFNFTINYTHRSVARCSSGQSSVQYTVLRLDRLPLPRDAMRNTLIGYVFLDYCDLFIVLRYYCSCVSFHQRYRRLAITLTLITYPNSYLFTYLLTFLFSENHQRM